MDIPDCNLSFPILSKALSSNLFNNSANNLQTSYNGTGLPLKFVKKSRAQISRDYRERKRKKLNIIKEPPKTAAQRSREYRLRKKKLMTIAVQNEPENVILGLDLSLSHESVKIETIDNDEELSNNCTDFPVISTTKTSAQIYDKNHMKPKINKKNESEGFILGLDSSLSPPHETVKIENTDNDEGQSDDGTDFPVMSTTKTSAQICDEHQTKHNINKKNESEDFILGLGPSLSPPQESVKIEHTEPSDDYPTVSTTKSSTEICDKYQRKQIINKRPAKTSTERVREYRLRKKQLLANAHSINEPEDPNLSSPQQTVKTETPDTPGLTSDHTLPYSAHNEHKTAHKQFKNNNFYLLLA